MKKLSLLLVSILLVGSMAGCSSKTTEETKPQGTTPAADAAYKWPVKNIEIVVPASAGGDTDFNARAMAKYFTKATGVTMVVTNMTGGGGTVATSHVKGAKNDGSIMLYGHTGQLLVNQVSGLADYGISAFEMCSIPAVDKGTVFVVSAESGIKSVADLVKASNTKPIIFGSELGGYTHLQGLIFSKLTGAKLDVVDVGAAAEKITNLLGGRIDLISVAYGAVKDYVETKKMVVIGQASGERNPLLGDIPTIKEQGFDFAMDKPYIAEFPKGTDATFVAQVSKTIKEIGSNPDYVKELAETYKQPVTYYNAEDSIKLLDGLLADYMKYQAELKK